MFLRPLPNLAAVCSCLALTTTPEVTRGMVLTAQHQADPPLSRIIPASPFPPGKPCLRAGMSHPLCIAKFVQCSTSGRCSRAQDAEGGAPRSHPCSECLPGKQPRVSTEKVRFQPKFQPLEKLSPPPAAADPSGDPQGWQQRGSGTALATGAQKCGDNPCRRWPPVLHLGKPQGEFQISGALWKILLAHQSGVTSWSPVQSSASGDGALFSWRSLFPDVSGIFVWGFPFQ